MSGASTQKARKKENRSDWVAVESDVQQNATKIKPAKSAFAFYRDEQFPKVKLNLEALGQKFELGQVQKDISEQWASLPEAERAPYNELAAQDKERYNRECSERDAEVEEEQRKRREEREAVETSDKFRHKRPEEVKAQAPKRVLTQDQLEAKAEREREKKEKEDHINAERENLAKEKADAASARLRYLLQQADIFQHFGVSAPPGSPRAKKSKKKSDRPTSPRAPGSPRHRLTEHEEDDELLNEYVKAPTRLDRQPTCIENGTLRAYQIEGLNWMISLAEKGINGILADEMGLGKTLQTISILGYTHEFKHVNGPHLVLAPKSTLSNWINEFRKWCPVLRTVKFHGDKHERQDLIENVLRPGHKDRKFDVVITSFEMAIKEKAALQKIAWRYLVIDEAHRIKNEASTFSTVVRTFHTHHRLLLTGTPLQNNLHELWALLNFLLPEVFGSSEQFDEWFNLDIDDDETKQTLITQLHKILRPFMLRRLKVDVEKSLPPKKETLLFVGLSKMQRQLYKKILLRDMEAVAGGSKNAGKTALLNIMMQLRKCCNHPYLFEGQEDRNLDPMGAHLIENCGKMVLMDKLLRKLKERGSRVLIFSQMTRMLDIFEDYCHMRSYQYCRIDGQTTYDEREAAIDAYNAPNSEKFIFLLSTRAGGLGINLYTADIVILYDSDWNPQADLQAQDRAHRIGQKKPVQVYRLVTDNSIEEKIIERAQQKLKLDAVVVQQGRLSEKQKNMSKDEMLEIIRFGAEEVFRATDGAITDADIDALMAQGEARTEEMNQKLEKHVKGDLLNFKLDGGISTQQFEGVDYSDKAERDKEMKRLLEQELALSLLESSGKRERRPVTNYNENEYFRQVTGQAPKKKGTVKALKKMEDWQFYDRERLFQLQQLEVDYLQATRNNDKGEGASNEQEALIKELQEEKARLLSEGFSDWKKAHFTAFIKLCARHGRDNIAAIARELEKTEERVAEYSEKFWANGPKVIGDWEKIVKTIEKGESKLLEIKKLVEATAEKISRSENPWERMTFLYQGKAGKSYTEEEDRYLLCFAHKYGYGEWDKVKAAIRRCDRFRFDYFIRSRTATELGRRCDTLMRLSEKENIEANKRMQSEKEMFDRLREEREKLMERRRKDEEALRQAQLEIDRKILEEAARLQQEREARMNAKIEEAAATAKEENSAAAERGSLKKLVPDHLIQALAEHVSTGGTQACEKVAKKFCSVHSQVSKRQVVAKINEIAVKEKRGVDTRPTWYVKPEYEHFVTQTPAKSKKRSAGDAELEPAKAKKKAKTAESQAKKEKKAKDKKSKGKDKSKDKSKSKEKKSRADDKDKDKKKKHKSSKKTKKEESPSKPSSAKKRSRDTSADKGPSKKKSKKQGDNPAVRKPRSAMILYSLAHRQEAKGLLPPDADTKALMKQLTDMWKNLPDDERKKWEDEAEQDQQRYDAELRQQQGGDDDGAESKSD